jgi:DNA repair exonuclease SbcCD nuclease subunit
LVIGDPHIKISNTVETDLMTAAIQKELAENKYDFTVIAGDVLDRFESIHVDPLTRAIAHVDAISKLSRHTYLLIGNHDRANNNVFLTDKHPFTALKQWSRLTVVDTVLVKEVTSMDGETASFVFAPYVYVGRLREALQTVKLDYPISDIKHEEEHWNTLRNVVCVFAHQEFHGAKIGIKKSTEGDHWPSDAPMCISGHIHDYCQLQKNMLYVGTPIQHGVTDITEKTISAFTFTLTEKVWNTEERRIDLKIPKKIHITITVEEILKFAIPTNASFVRLDIEIDPIEYRRLIKDPHIVKLIKAGVQIKPIDIRKKIDKAEIKRNNFKMCYEKRLNKSIKREEKEVQEVFTELFGPITPIKKSKVKIVVR